MSAIRVITTVSVLLGLGTFVGALALAPLAKPREPVYLSRSTPSTVATIQQIRGALNDRRPRAALNLSRVATEARPEDLDAWLWLAYTRREFGDPARAPDAAARLLALVDSRRDAGLERPRSDQGVTEPSGMMYRRAWAYELLGRRAEARAEFARAADRFELETQASGAAIIQYNLACYRAMAGQLEEACGHFENWVSLGATSDGGWWSVDPDLHPLRELPRFQRAALGLTPARSPEPAPDPDPGQG